MKKLLFCLSVFALAFPAHAATLIEDLGSKYNALILGDLTVDSADTEGRQLVTGDFTVEGPSWQLTYSIGEAAASSGRQNPASSGRDDMVVGGDVTTTNNAVVQVTEDAVVGGTAVVASVTFYTTMTGVSSGDGKLIQGVAPLYVARTTSESNVTTSADPDGVALADLRAGFRSESTQLSQLADSAGVSVSGRVVTVTDGGSAKTYVANMSGTDWNQNGNVDIDLSRGPPGSTVVVNVSGADIDKSGSNVVLTGIDERKVLLNFYEATSWKSMYIDVKGSVLAPFAQTATISGGAITGTSIIAGDVTKTGSAEFHNSLFTGDLSVVPEPGNAGLLGLLAAAGLSLRSRCRLAGGAA